jgi:type IV secretory pathway VirD2 relaxase
MNTHDDDLRIRLGRIRNRGARYKGFFAEVRSAARNEGYVGPQSRSPRASRFTPSYFGRGRGGALRPRSRSGLGAGYGASTLPHAGLLNSTRRVLVKARIVRHRGPRAATLSAHVRYLKREGVTRTGETARMFTRETDLADERAFAEHCRDDRHHFRLIVSPDDAAEMTDLRAFARELVADMERDLGTKLEWIGVDHYNTDNPHLHILVRGKADDGRDLVISRDYISRGIRARAQDLATVELGPKPEHEIRSVLEREVEADRWTQLDTVLRREADETGFIDLRPVEPVEQQPGLADLQIRGLMIGRLQRLERMGLATNAGPSQWVIGVDAETTLRDLAIRSDIIKTMHKALGVEGVDRALTDYTIHGSNTPPIIGRLVAKGLHDELTGEAYAVIDAVDGRAHHVRFRDAETLELAPPIGGIVEVWRIDVGARRELALAARSDLPIKTQITAVGSTWLDRQLVSRERVSLSEAGFGHEIRQALQARIDHLAAEGLAYREGQGVIFARQLIETLRRRELNAVAADIASKTGLEYYPATVGDSVNGTYRQRLNLTSGRFAMIEDGLGFSLVPWKPALERHLGRQVSGLARAETVDWSFGRKRTLGID